MFNLKSSKPIRIAAIFTACTVALSAPAAFAAGNAVVQAVQMPAWVVRNGQAPTPLVPGMTLSDRDQIRTGGDARVLVKLAEGSSVKLGENARLDIVTVEQSKGVFNATMSVLTGAFRFTTDALSKLRKRDVAITVGTATAGIRGTDLWGKSNNEKDIICLLEGKISVERGADELVNLSEPLQFYVAPKGGKPEIAAVTPAQVTIWAQETEVQSGAGAATAGGKWKLTLASAATQAEALSVYDQLRAGGYAATIRPVKKSGNVVYKVRIVQLPSQMEANALGKKLQGKFGATEASVSI